MKEVTDRRYPIGRFEYGKNYSLDDTRKQIKDLARLPKELKKLVKKLKDGALDKPYRQGGWTARQVIHHLADSHVNAYIRFKLAVTETAPIIKPYEEQLWAETEDAKHGSAKTSIKLLSALHSRWVDFMISLSEDDLEKGYFHPATKRSVSLREAIALYAWHCRHHLAHIKLVAEGNLDSAKSKTKKKEPTLKPAKSTRKQMESSSVPEAAAAQEKPKRGRRPSAEVAAAKAAKANTPKLSRAEILEKARAARAASKAAAAPAPAQEKPKRGRRPSAEVAAAKAAKANTPKLSRAEILEKARAARAANKAAAAPAPAQEKPKRARRSSAEVEAAKAAKANAPKLSRAEILEKARAARAANKAAAAPAPVQEKPKRARRSSAEIAATSPEKPDKAPKVAKSKQGNTPKPKAIRKKKS